MRETLTLLLTDVVDSTELNSRLGDEVMTPLWASHDRESRALMQQWRAREIGRSDGFLLLFEQVFDALGFAYSYARALRSLDVPLRARIGLHTGPLELRRNSASDVVRGAPQVEVDGLALPLAARLMAAASGGQTLLSSDCWHLLAPHLEEGWLTIDVRRPETAPQLRDSAAAGKDVAIRLRLLTQGHWRLRGIDQPVEVFQAGSEQDDFTPPAESAKAYRVVREGAEWRPVRGVPGNLPAERNLFVGRAWALRAITERFETGARLVSVLGMGGVGKTRLSLRYARGWLGDYSGGAWFCDLSAARGLQGILYAVSQALNVPLDKTDPVQLIAAAIAGRGHCLVILDNFEQVARQAEETLGHWLQRAPQARFIVTSREQLGIAGEHVLVLDPLSVPEANALLRERMTAAGANLPLEPEDVAAIGPLVDLLDRLPLAIELAASRGRVMRPAELLARMGQRFKLLAGRSGRHDRQATLRATLDWSWDLLSPIERAALAQSSIFESGFTLAAAEAVLDLSRFEADPWVADVLQALVEKSLLRRSSVHRLDMLRSVHDYATQRLSEACEAERSTAMQRHWRYYGGLSEQAAIADRCIEADNLVAACRRATAAADLDAAADALIAVWSALNLTGPFKVAVEMAQDLYRVARSRSRQVAMTARWVAGSARYLAGDVAAAQDDLEAATWAGGSLSLRARALGALGQLERSLGHFARADELLEAGLSAARQTGDGGLVCRAYNALGILRLSQGRLDAAHRCLSVGLDAARSAKDLKQQAALLGNIGVVERRQGRDDSAFQRYQQALRLAQEIGDRRFEGNMRSNLGLFHQHHGRCAEALVELQAALDIAKSSGLVRLSANVCCNLGLVHEELGDGEGALDRHREAVGLADSLNDASLAGHFRIYAGRLQLRLGRGPEARAMLDAAERMLEYCADTAVSGLLACANAEWAASHGDINGRRHWIDLARQRAKESGASPSSELAQELLRAGEQTNSR